GLAKFRATRAEFKNFRVGKQLPSLRPADALVERVTKATAKLSPKGPLSGAVVESLTPDAPASLAVLRDRARLLEQQAAQLRDLAQGVHQKSVLIELAKVVRGHEKEIDLLHAALLVAKLDIEELDVAVYRRQVERMARELAAALPRDADEKAKIAALNKYL